MFCKSYIREGTHDGKQMVAAELITKSVPAEMPTLTDGIDNVDSGMVLGPGSSLITTTPFGAYLMDDEFDWSKIGG